ncbi:MAG TPA: hypothetical protein VM266_09985 [Solirubrobacteraceae bacterium]|nr:hypothetical protein [Solirubrobacteraceae bacterium]
MASGNLVVETNLRADVPALEGLARRVMGLASYEHSRERRERSR